MMTQILLLSIVVCSCQGQQPEECSDRELQELQSQISQCAVQREYQFEETRDTSPGVQQVEEAACVLISKTVSECGAAWEKCHTKPEVQRLLDMHLESLLAQHSSISLSSCGLVSEYLQSGRREENREQETRCSDRRSVQGQQGFQTCSHSESTLAYENILEIEDSVKIQNILCETLGRIGSVCSRELEECFSSEDLLRMTKSHLTEMEKFLVSFAAGKIGDDDLTGCGLVEFTEIEKLETKSSDESKEGLNDAVETDIQFIEDNLIKDASENAELYNVASELRDAELYTHEQPSTYQDYNNSSSGRQWSVVCLIICLVAFHI
eukprot:GFUD01025754.1.p1 GENE.GFUD01025754.1~~GFUD01025754.1.p1  ORF type:complete len:323 (-),score=100.79 GFUD01025754.1:35-1003(-)